MTVKASILLAFAIAVGLEISFRSTSSQTQTDLNLRSAQEYRAAEAELTSTYGKLKRTPALNAAQRAWIAYRDAECLYEHHATPDGSMYSMEESICKTKLTRQRIAVLKDAIAEGYGG
jgi:uncharacterized protein YecT (DUF1311 family)